MVERGLLHRRVADTWRKMRRGVMIVEMTTEEQQSNGNARSTKNVKGGLIQDLKKTARKESSVSLEEALKD